MRELLSHGGFLCSSLGVGAVREGIDTTPAEPLSGPGCKAAVDSHRRRFMRPNWSLGDQGRSLECLLQPETPGHITLWQVIRDNAPSLDPGSSTPSESICINHYMHIVNMIQPL